MLCYHPCVILSPVCSLITRVTTLVPYRYLIAECKHSPLSDLPKSVSRNELEGADGGEQERAPHLSRAKELRMPQYPSPSPLPPSIYLSSSFSHFPSFPPLPTPPPPSPPLFVNPHPPRARCLRTNNNPDWCDSSDFNYFVLSCFVCMV